jgi:hypothetical protein
LLYVYIDKKNSLTEVKLAIPQLEREVKALELERTALQYELKSFENPSYLMQLLKRPEYSHLHFPKEGEVIKL